MGTDLSKWSFYIWIYVYSFVCCFYPNHITTGTIQLSSWGDKNLAQDWGSLVMLGFKLIIFLDLPLFTTFTHRNSLKHQSMLLWVITQKYVKLAIFLFQIKTTNEPMGYLHEHVSLYLPQFLCFWFIYYFCNCAIFSQCLQELLKINISDVWKNTSRPPSCKLGRALNFMLCHKFINTQLWRYDINRNEHPS